MYPVSSACNASSISKSSSGKLLSKYRAPQLRSWFENHICQINTAFCRFLIGCVFMAHSTKQCSVNMYRASRTRFRISIMLDINSTPKRIVFMRQHAPTDWRIKVNKSYPKQRASHPSSRDDSDLIFVRKTDHLVTVEHQRLARRDPQTSRV